MDGDRKEHPGRKVYTSPPAVVSLLLLIFLWGLVYTISSVSVFLCVCLKPWHSLAKDDTEIESVEVFKTRWRKHFWESIAGKWLISVITYLLQARLRLKGTCFYKLWKRYTGPLLYSVREPYDFNFDLVIRRLKRIIINIWTELDFGNSLSILIHRHNSKQYWSRKLLRSLEEKLKMLSHSTKHRRSF